MLSRRKVMQAVGSGSLGVSIGAMAAIPAEAATATSYDEAVRDTWAPLRPDGGHRELVRMATLAANSHNTQPWKFALEDRRISISADTTRRCPAVDPDDHHVFASLGCAAENLVQAASAMSLAADVAFDGDRLEVRLDRGAIGASPLVPAITRRQCTRARYDGKPVANEALRTLEGSGAGRGISVRIVTDAALIARIADLVVQGNMVQMRDRAFMTELKSWLRFNDVAAVATRDGLFSRSSGNTTMPNWIASLVLPFVFTEKGENDKYRDHISSSSGVAVFASEKSDKHAWVEAGRACQRFALQATALGLRYAFVNQPIEVANLKPDLASLVGLGGLVPELVVRFGAGPELPRSLRRPVEAVIV